MESRAEKFETVVQNDGVILFPGVRAGEHIEVSVHRLQPSGAKVYPLRGTNARYDAPFEPAIPETDWDSRT